MRTRTAVALAAVVAVSIAALPGSAAAARKKPAKCSASRSTTIAQTKDVRVYSQPKKDDYDQGYACLYKTGKRVLLANVEECMGTDKASSFEIAGHYVGWVSTSCGLDEGTSQVVVTDVAKGKNVVRGSGAVPANPNADLYSTSVRDLVVSPTGAAAWIGTYSRSSGDTPTPDDRIQVSKAAPGGMPGGTLVDSGPDIVTGSLALSSTGFYYRKGTTPLFEELQ